MNKSGSIQQVRLSRVAVVAAMTMLVVAMRGVAAGAQAFISRPTGAQDGGYHWYRSSYWEPSINDYVITTSFASWPDSVTADLATDTGGVDVTWVEERGALIYFPVSGVPTQIVAARLRFWASYVGKSLSVYHLDGAVGDEISSPYNSGYYWSRTGGFPIGLPVTSTGMWFDYDVTSVVRQDLEAARTFSAFNLQGNAMTVYLSESGQYAPSLTLLPVPEPSSLAGLALGLSGCIGLLNRRRTT